MSFFTESSDEKTIVLFATHDDIDDFKAFLSNMGGTFCRELETKKGNKYPAWIFDISKRQEIEAFVREHDDERSDSRSVSSIPDIEILFDEIFRRLEALEKDVEDISNMVDFQK